MVLIILGSKLYIEFSLFQLAENCLSCQLMCLNVGKQNK